MRKLFFSVIAAVCAACFATESQAQYNPYAQQGRIAPAAPVQQFSSFAVQPASVAMRPSTTTYAAAPTPGLRPVNPPSAATQKLLLASRTSPSPQRPIAQTASKQPVAPPQQYWNPSANAQSWEQTQGAAYGAAPAAPMAPTPDAGVGGYGVPAPAAGGECCGTGGACGGDACGCAPACGGCCCLTNCCLRSPGDMVQHMPHFGTTHGYYYFRPYHVMHVFSQQELATRWGGDPRNPYDNTMFQTVYQQMGVDAATQKAREEHAAKTAVPKTGMPSVQEYIVPTPVPGYQGAAPQYVPGMEVPQGAVPAGIPAAPAVEYVPNK